MRNKIITAIPFLMLFVTAISGYCSSIDYYNVVFKYLGDIIGYSIVTNIVFMFLYFRKSFCLQTKIAVCGLLFMNVLSIFFSYNNILYNGLYDFWITLILLVIILISIFK
tara:strand:+ start:9816 stop:10145 length:330 start_codon:yes stop_codon:yes gene_type:complete